MDFSKSTYGESTSAPSTATADLAVVAEDGESGLVAKRDVDDTVVGKCAHGSESSRLLSTTLGTGADEQTGILAPEGARGPLATSPIPESSPLCREVAVTGGDAHEEGIVLLEDRGVADLGDRCVLGRSVHLGQDLLGKSLRDAEQVDLTASLADALGLGLSEGLDVTPGGVLEEVMLVMIHWNVGFRYRCAVECESIEPWVSNIVE